MQHRPPSPAGTAVHSFNSDLAGTDYRLFLEMMLPAHRAFSLVWREQLTFHEQASTIRADLKRYEVDSKRTDRWPGTRLMHGAGRAFVVQYRADDGALSTLLRPGSLFSWVAPGYPEDLAFYDDAGLCTFASVSHDREAYILAEMPRAMLATLVSLDAMDVGDDVVAILRGT